MILKCIGGVCDGMKVDVGKHYHQGDCARVPDYPTTISEMEFTPTSLIACDYQIYQIDILKWNDDKEKRIREIWFLRPTNFTTFDAMQFAFNR